VSALSEEQRLELIARMRATGGLRPAPREAVPLPLGRSTDGVPTVTYRRTGTAHPLVEHYADDEMADTRARQLRAERDVFAVRVVTMAPAAGAAVRR
jgi:hypothetical protein